ncbi:hypothetical protein V8E53_000023 [Lactarius tabidus]
MLPGHSIFPRLQQPPPPSLSYILHTAVPQQQHRKMMFLKFLHMIFAIIGWLALRAIIEPIESLMQANGWCMELMLTMSMLRHSTV